VLVLLKQLGVVVVVEVVVVCACESVGRETRGFKSTFPCLLAVEERVEGSPRRGRGGLVELKPPRHQ